MREEKKNPISQKTEAYHNQHGANEEQTKGYAECTPTGTQLFCGEATFTFNHDSLFKG